MNLQTDELLVIHFHLDQIIPYALVHIKPCKSFISTPNYHTQKGYLDFVPEQLIYVSGSINRNVPFLKAGLINSVNLIVFTVFSICDQKAELHLDAPKMGTRKLLTLKAFRHYSA